uniref:Reverse transcriptase domain-containing protein n=1 Tax=Tanacetum cinerariifolium TaxID=118510 RepID=A0A6L2LG45_TANCI|nr:hypothetical protein [Tanacetum cinerariifolium]
MTDNHTMAEMLRAPNEGCAKAIIVPPILAEQFELKHSLINMMTSEYKDLLRACPHHGFNELHQLDTFYNALNPADQDSLKAAASGNLLEKSPQDALTIIENKSKTSAMTTVMTAMLKQFQSNPPSVQVKDIEEIHVTCGGAHPYYQCFAAGGNTFSEYRDTIQGYVSAATGNYNQANLGYRAQGVANQMRPPEKIKKINDVSLKAMQNQIDMVKNKLRNEMKTSIQTSLSNQTNEIKNMMASLLQMNTASASGSGTLPSNTIANPKGDLKAITTCSGLVTEGPIVPNPLKSVNPEEDECVEETYTDLDHAEYNIKVSPPPPIQKPKPPIQRNFVLHTRDSLPPHIPCKALVDLGASINLMSLSVWKKLVGKFTFPADFVVVDFESNHRVPLIFGRPFLRTARALIDVHGEEMILRNGDESEDCLEVLVSNKQSDNPTFSLHKEIASPKVIHEFYDSKGCTFLSEELPDIDSFNDIHPHFDDDPLSGSTTYSANSLLEEFTDELALITYPLDYDINHAYSIDQFVLTHHDDLFVDLTPEMFTDEQPPDYSFPPRFDVYPDDFLEIESDDTFDDDLFNFEGEDNDLPYPDNEDKVFNPGILSHAKSVKIITRVTQEKKLANSFASWLFEDFDPPFYELLAFKEVPNSTRLLPFSSENEEKVFKPGIYISKKVKENSKKDKIESKPDKNEKHGEAGKSQKQLQ